MPLLNAAHDRTFGVEQLQAEGLRDEKAKAAPGAAGGFFLERAENLDAHRFVGADDAAAAAMRALHHAAFGDAGAQALARHFEQAEGANAAELDFGAVGFQ